MGHPDRDAAGEAVLVIPADAPVGTSGRYATVPGCLEPERWAELERVRFRVSHPLGEWRARLQGGGIFAGRAGDPRLEHDIRLLESLLRERERLS